MGTCSSRTTLSSAIGPPIAAVCPPGQCVFRAEEWTPAKLLERTQETHDTFLLTFGLQDATKPLGLSTCACILCMITEEGADAPIIRPYTPVSTNAMLGKFQLVIKVYPEGKMTQHMVKMAIGDDLNFKHIDKNVKVQYPFGKKHITMLCGGTAISPMIQALHAILGTKNDETQVVMLFGNKTEKDCLCKELLDDWESNFPDRLKVVHVLSDAKDNPEWTGEKGFITKELIAKYCVPPSNADSLIMVCGPPPMYDALCGPRDKPDELSGALSDMGYTAEQVFKF